jgi:hypothetical protein
MECFNLERVGQEDIGMKPEPRERNLLETEKLVENTQAVPPRAPEDLELERGTSWCRFNPNVRVTEDMMWHAPQELMRRKSQDRDSQKEPTWASLFRQVVLGFFEVLMPLAFILGMIYWRAPWLFWAMIRLLKGEPLFRF